MEANTQVREALTKALADVGSPSAADAPQSRSEGRRTYVSAAPVIESDPRYAEYGERLLDAARSDAVAITFDSFWAWRQRHPELDGVGAITLIRLWRSAQIESVVQVITG